jgi:hypothetical protein
MTQNVLMNILQVTVLVLVAAGATVVVRTGERVRLAPAARLRAGPGPRGGNPPLPERRH